MNCPNCGAPVGPNDRFCTSCGIQFQSQSAAGQANYSAGQTQYSTSQAGPSYQGYQQSYAQQPQQQSYTQQSYTQQPPQVQIYTTPSSTQDIPYQYKPLSPWAYFGYGILFCIPIVGFILLIVFSFSSDNINRRNYARSYWCGLLIAVIIIVVLSLLGVAVFSFISDAVGDLM